MSLIDSLLRITPYPRFSAFIWVFALLLALYLARNPFRQVIKSLTRIISNALRLAAASVLNIEAKVVRRNREVLLARGLEHVEQKLERVFSHINKVDVRNLESYATLHHKISEVINKLEEDHTRTIDVPPSLPNWNPVIEAVANIEHSGDTMVANMLSEIKTTLERQHAESLADYRSSSKTRQNLLNKMLPRWRDVHKKLVEVGKLVTLLSDRANKIDRYMDDYLRIRAKTVTVERVLTSSSLTQFLVSGFLLLATAGGVLLNFHLIALPMSEMVGTASYVGPYATSEAVAFVLTFVELSLGLFLIESLRLTRLVPIIGSMDEKARRSLVWISLALLTVLAGVESSLAVLRNQMVADAALLNQMLAGVEPSRVSTSMIPTAGHMVMGFILPFWMAASALPLVSFLTASRTVLGIVAAAGLRFCAFILRLFSNVTVNTGKFVVSVYDMLIFPTLWIEGVLGGPAQKLKPPPRPKTGIHVLNRPKHLTNNRDQLEYNKGEK